MSAAIFARLREAALAGAWTDAARGLEQLDAHWPQADVAALRAWVALAQDDREAAAHWLATTFAREPDHVEALTLALDLARRVGRHGEALQYAQRLVVLTPRSALAHYNLGVAREAAGEGDAQPNYDMALALEPDHLPGLAARGWLLLERGVAQLAAADFARLLALQPNDGAAWIGAGACALARLDAAGALACFERALEYLPREAMAWRGRADALEQLGRIDDSLHARRQCVALAGTTDDSACELAMALSRAGEPDAARHALAARAARGSALAQWLAFQLLPIVYRDADDIARWREHWRAGLAAFDARAQALDAAECAAVLASTPGFFRHYLDDDLLDDQRRAAAVVERMVRVLVPAPRVRSSARCDGRLRIGFASAHLHRHTVGRLFGGFIAGLDRTRFEVVVASLSRDPGAGEAMRGHADAVLGPHASVAAWVDALANADVDALLWLDIGMDGTTQALSALRFAPLQCMFWGHPVSSGLAAIDVFISAAAMEGADAARRYSERLHLLPGLGLGCRAPASARPRAAAAAVGAPVRLVCAQSIYKLLPQHDALFARVLAAAPTARLELTPGALPPLRERLLARMRPVFEAHGVDFQRRVQVHPRLAEDAFGRVLDDADLLLDSVGWSGGQTSLEGLARDVPVLTLPGAGLRSRHSMAFVDTLGLAHDLVASDADDYVARAAALARDADARQALSGAIGARKALLFDSRAATVALQDFLWQACGR